MAGATLDGLFDAQAARTPNAPALAFEGDTLTYAELDRRASALACALQADGVGPEAIVPLIVDRSAEAIVAVLGILKAGGAYLPIDPAAPPERIALMLDDADARAIVTETRLRGRVPAGPWRVQTLDTFDWTRTARPAAAGGDAHLAYVIYTSGSTGRPKGVCIEHRQIVAYVRAVVERLALGPGLRHATVSTLAADLGHTVIFPSLLTGGCLHVIAQSRLESAAALGDYFTRERIDVLKIVPSHLAALQSGRHPERIMPRRRLILGGEASRLDWIEQLRALAPACEIFNHYGPTETTVGVLMHRVGPRLPRTRTGTLPLGIPLPHGRVYIVDEHGAVAPHGTEGELWIGGASVGRGYLNRPELTAERFVPDRFGRDPGGRLYRTGDLARWLTDGTVEFCGRIDDQIKIRGYRVEPGEVAAALREHPAVDDVHVLAKDDGDGGRHLVAYVVPTSARGRTPAGPTEMLTAATLRASLHAKLPPYMVPAAFVLLDEFPLTANGKVDRRALPPPAVERAAAPAAVEPAMRPTEAALARIWSEILNVGVVRPKDNFFELGGHSLMAMRTMARIRDTFGIDVPLRALFEGPTVSGLAALIDGLLFLANTGSDVAADAGREEIAL